MYYMKYIVSLLKYRTKGGAKYIMSDYVKDLNIVDFLGIIVPGSILVLLIAGDNAPLFLLWSSYFGADASPIVRGIFLAIAGYLAGMILHEIGDLAEKGVWCFTALDPKAYAINAVGIDELSKAAKKAPLNTEVSPDRNCVFPSCVRGILGCILAVLILAGVLVDTGGGGQEEDHGEAPFGRCALGRPLRSPFVPVGTVSADAVHQPGRP